MRILPNRKIVKRDIDREQIKKNSNIDIEYNIKRIKKERRYTLILVIFFMALILTIFGYIFGNIKTDISINSYKTGNLDIVYEVDLNGVKDVINLSKNKKTDNIYFTVQNNSYDKAKFNIYLVDNEDLIKLDGCEKKIISYDKLYYSVNFEDEKNVLGTKKKNKYLLKSEEISGNAKKEYRLKVLYDKNIDDDYHYHGKVIVKNVNN